MIFYTLQVQRICVSGNVRHAEQSAPRYIFYPQAIGFSILLELRDRGDTRMAYGECNSGTIRQMGLYTGIDVALCASCHAGHDSWIQPCTLDLCF